ncbi:MAG TPA: energy-coupling factor transporter transmembrane component T [Holophaga sp.]|nr:energy-coupling factor transporter transmembrane component T [Holophaga sp.]
MQVPEWLLQDARYEPRADRDAFLDRSILAFLAVLARSRARAGRGEQARLDALVKVLCALVVVLLVSLARSTAFLALAGTGLLVVLALQSGRVIAAVLRTCLGGAAFTALVLLPSAFWGTGPAALIIAFKVVCSLAAVRLVSATTPWPEIPGAFKRLHVPDLFILVLDIALKYITRLGEFALSMLHALKLRSVGRNPGKTAALGGIVGTLFLKSKEMAEETYAAMECRGFTGDYRPAAGARLRLRDWLLCAATGLLVAAFFATAAR